MGIIEGLFLGIVIIISLIAWILIEDEFAKFRKQARISIGDYISK